MSLSDKELIEFMNIISDKWVYVIKNSMGLYKIGITQHLSLRLSEIRKLSGCGLYLIFAFKPEKEFNPTSKEIEKELHVKFKEIRQHGEWFNLSLRDLVFTRNYFYEWEGWDFKDNSRGWYNDEPEFNTLNGKRRKNAKRKLE